MEEVDHLVEVIKNSQSAILKKDATTLKDLSNQTIHQAATHQDEGCITLAVLIYTLSKLIERKDYTRVKTWDKFTKKFCSYLDLASKTLREGNETKYLDYLKKCRKALTSISLNLKPYIQEVIRKAEINKASKIYEHGISMEATAKMLGITQWELSEYSGQRQLSETAYDEKIDVKKRAKMAMEFFS